jgi:hypothetical protein
VTYNKDPSSVTSLAFQDGLRQDKQMPGWLSKGYTWSDRRDNGDFPFVYFSNGELISLN